MTKEFQQTNTPEQPTRHESEPLLELPEELIYRRQLQSPPDRFGTVASLDFSVDIRPETITISYTPTPINNGVENYFEDDFVRYFNKQLANGGKDLRSFSLTDPLIIQKRNEYRRIHEQEMNEALKRLQGIIPPIRIAVEHDSKTTVQKYYTEGGDNDSDSAMHSVFTWRILKNNASERISSENGGAIYNHKTEMSEKEREKTALAKTRGNTQATELLREELKRLQELEKTQEVIELRKRYENAHQAIGIMNGSIQLNLPILLTQKNLSDSERAEELLRFKEENPEDWQIRAEYSPKYRSNPAEELGTEGTREWYKLQGINIDLPIIDFTEINTNNLKANFFALRQEKEQRDKENRKRENQQAEFLRVQEEAQRNQEKERQEQARAANLEAAFTKDICREIEDAIQKQRALYLIVSAIPADSAEKKKWKENIGLGNPNTEEQDYRAKNTEPETILKKIQERFAALKNHAARPKINIEIPQLWNKVQAILEKWQEIPGKVKQDENAQFIISEELISETDLIAQVQKGFLANPWTANTQGVLNAITLRILNDA